MRGNLEWIYLGEIDYGEGLRLQERVHKRVSESASDGIVLFVEHLPVVTVGRFGRSENVLFTEYELQSRGVRLYKSSRGGDVTFHAPGQITAYPILPLRRFRIGARAYVALLEEAIIASLLKFDIQAERIAGYPGVWVEGEKIASVGVSVKGGATMHGFALNANVNLDGFTLIVPCGIPNVKMTSMQRILGREIAIEGLCETLASELASGLNLRAVRVRDLG